MSPARDPFPLATALTRIIHEQVRDIVAGQPCKLMGQVTPTTAKLLKFWFEQNYCDARFLNFHEGQRTAILHIIYAHEVLHSTNLRDLYQAVAPETLLEGSVIGEVGRARHGHPKYAAKMATGTGKTWVLNALLLWQYLNKVAEPNDDRFTNNFLLVAPGLIVYERLLDSFLGKLRNGERDFETSDIFSQQDLFVPENHRMAAFGFLQSAVIVKTDIGRRVTGFGMIAITNQHLLAGQEDSDFAGDEDTMETDVATSGLVIDRKAAVESFFPLTPGTATGNSLDTLDRRYLRGAPLQALVDLPDLLVCNDEAHHIHEVHHADEVPRGT